MRKQTFVFNLVLALMLALGAAVLFAPSDEVSAVPAPACPANSTWQDGEGCVCDPGYRQVGERRVAKVVDAKFDADAGFWDWGFECVLIEQPEQPDTDGDGVPDDQDECPDRGNEGHGVNAVGCPNLPPDGIADWPGNPLSPNYDGRRNTAPADPFVTYCRDGQLQVYNTDGFVTQVPLSAVQGMGAPMSFGNSGYTVSRSGDSLVVAGPPPDNFSVNFSLTECLTWDAGH